jgi:hypothetical protein
MLFVKPLNNPYRYFGAINCLISILVPAAATLAAWPTASNDEHCSGIHMSACKRRYSANGKMHIKGTRTPALGGFASERLLQGQGTTATSAGSIMLVQFVGMAKSGA